MASRGRGRRGRPRGAGQAPSTFDQPSVFTQQAFAEAVDIATAAITQESITGSQGGPSNLQRFRAHHPVDQRFTTCVPTRWARLAFLVCCWKTI